MNKTEKSQVIIETFFNQLCLLNSPEGYESSPLSQHSATR